MRYFSTSASRVASSSCFFQLFFLHRALGLFWGLGRTGHVASNLVVVKFRANSGSRPLQVLGAIGIISWKAQGPWQQKDFYYLPAYCLHCRRIMARSIFAASTRVAHCTMVTEPRLRPVPPDFAAVDYKRILGARYGWTQYYCILCSSGPTLGTLPT